MSRPRDPDGSDDGTGWHEPAHLGEGGSDPGRDEPAPAWEPPGWSLPSPERQAQQGPWSAYPDAAAGVLADLTDPFGAHVWALQRGWTVGDGSDPRDAVLAELLAAAPVRRLSSDYRPA